MFMSVIWFCNSRHWLPLFFHLSFVSSQFLYPNDILSGLGDYTSENGDKVNVATTVKKNNLFSTHIIQDYLTFENNLPRNYYKEPEKNIPTNSDSNFRRNSDSTKVGFSSLLRSPNIKTNNETTTVMYSTNHNSSLKSYLSSNLTQSGNTQTHMKLRVNQTSYVPTIIHTENKLKNSSSVQESKNNYQCNHCQNRVAKKLQRIENVKHQILRQMHVTSLPNVTAKSVPKALFQMSKVYSNFMQADDISEHDVRQYTDEEYSMLYTDVVDERYNKPERIFTTAKQPPEHLYTRHFDNTCYFSMSEEIIGAKITHAFLWFYVLHPVKATSSVVFMKVSRLGPPKDMRKTSKRMLWMQKSVEMSSGWKKVDISNTVRRWVKHPSSNYGLEIIATIVVENLIILPPTSTESDGYEPILDIKIMKEKRHRSRRSDTLTCSANSTEYRCCRFPLEIRLAQFGWDWVIAPTQVKVDYCAGDCTMTLQNETPHSWISSQSRTSNNERITSCCSPTKLSSLPFLYFNGNGDIILQILTNVRVDKCGCM